MWEALKDKIEKFENNWRTGIVSDQALTTMVAMAVDDWIGDEAEKLVNDWRSQ